MDIASVFEWCAQESSDIARQVKSQSAAIRSLSWRYFGPPLRRTSGRSDAIGRPPSTQRRGPMPALRARRDPRAGQRSSNSPAVTQRIPCSAVVEAAASKTDSLASQGLVNELGAVPLHDARPCFSCLRMHVRRIAGRTAFVAHEEFAN
jgi:hypothetical protein